MKTEIPLRAAVPFPPIRQAICCPGRQQEPRRQPKKKVQPSAPQPPPPPNFSHSWPKAGFQLGGRRPQPRLLGPRLAGNSCASAPASASGASARRGSGHSQRTGRAGGGEEEEEEEERFSLSLTPEAVLVIQKRILERQQLTGRSKGKAAPRCPAAPPSSDIGSLLKISLLNDQHKYDDVEYEEDGEGSGPPDSSVLQKCLEWLRGVESARGPAGRLARLPQLAR
ncbi:proline-rich protein 18 [Pristis pectinata]|uniref:proline-rich protein 18 n=1 Tax=Pristis pectinata TaxID=685728 RepID=UPI00223CE3DC|nr:proline-rich protein 18 [Pristis pectinata]